MLLLIIKLSYQKIHKHHWKLLEKDGLPSRKNAFKLGKSYFSRVWQMCKFYSWMILLFISFLLWLPPFFKFISFMSSAKYLTYSSYLVFRWLTVWDCFSNKEIVYDISNNHRYIYQLGFSKQSLDMSFYWLSQADHKIDLLLILIWILPHEIDLIALHCISRYKF